MRPRVHPRPRSLARAVLATGVFLLATGLARADTPYKLQPIVKLGDTVAGITVKAQNGAFLVYGLTDSGGLTFTTWVGGLPNGVAVLQYADGKFTPIAVADREGPIGTWAEDLILYEPASMNELGNLAFAAASWNEGDILDLGTFLWDAQTGKVSVVAREGMPAGSDLVFETGGGFSPMLNNRNEIAFPAIVKNDGGIFFKGSEGPIVPVAIPGQDLPGSHTLASADNPTLNDAGVVAFPASRQGDPDDGRNYAYLWEKGTITELVAARTDAPGGGKFARIFRAWVNNANRNVLILARLNYPDSGPAGLYLLANGKLAPVAIRGQEMPGGGQLRDLPLNQYEVSSPNRLGQHAFMATLADGSTAAYRMEADGKLSLILKAGDVTEFGKVTKIGRQAFPPCCLVRGGFCLGLNNKGQVALPVQIEGGPDTIVLLTPVAQ